MSSLLDKNLCEVLTEDIAEDYEEIREEHYDSLKVSSCICHASRSRIDFSCVMNIETCHPQTHKDDCFCSAEFLDAQIQGIYELSD